MYRLIGLLLSIIMTVPAAFASTGGSDQGIFVPGRFMSMAGAADGSVYLLDDKHQLVCVKPDGSQATIALPRIQESKAADRLCDLAVDGRTIAFCGFAFPVIFTLDLDKPESFQITRASDQESASLHLLNISRDASGWRVRDADGLVFKMQHARPISRLPEFSALEADENGKVILMPPPRNENGLMIAGRVQKEDGRLLWVAPVPTAPRQVMSVDFLGFDKAGCHNFVVMTASGELNPEFTVYAVRRGQVVASGKIPGPAGLEMQHFCRLSPDGSILYAQAAPEKESGIFLKKLKLTKAN
ncbi:MAG TPA: hypothetical protein PLM07_09735 [Candidatus Rifleibacterium sp.]|nr:hypothetical protein [Candidatus Rifleibacterium sp.]HPT46167.1 hypothetical protein [Candidatus Rifleibacterium sp.]